MSFAHWPNTRRLSSAPVLLPVGVVAATGIAAEQAIEVQGLKRVLGTLGSGWRGARRARDGTAFEMLSRETRDQPARAFGNASDNQNRRES